MNLQHPILTSFEDLLIFKEGRRHSFLDLYFVVLSIEDLKNTLKGWKILWGFCTLCSQDIESFMKWKFGARLHFYLDPMSFYEEKPRSILRCGIRSVLIPRPLSEKLNRACWKHWPLLSQQCHQCWPYLLLAYSPDGELITQILAKHIYIYIAQVAFCERW